MPLSNKPQDDDNSTKIVTGTFKYGLKSQADRARMLQQQGINPEPHRFQPDKNNPDMCNFEGCYATLEARKSWHIQAFFDG